MCGRGDQTLKWADILRLLRILEAEQKSNLQPNYNVSPTQDVFVAAEHDGERSLKQLRWGLIPIWAKSPSSKPLINARAETIEEKPSFKGSLKKMRCIVPLSGFYEWTGPKGNKQPFRVTRVDGDPLLMAGIWSFNDKIDGEIRSFALITTEPNKKMAELHHRMPVILNPNDVDKWLTGEWGDDKKKLLKPCPNSWLTAYPVDKAVNSTRNNHPELIAPIGSEYFGSVPDDDTLRKTCERKKSFKTQSQANKAGVSLNQYSYECPLCYTWHLTSLPPDEQPKAARA